MTNLNPNVVEEVLYNFDLLVLSFAAAYIVVETTIYIINQVQERQIDTTRVNEGLPTDVTITQEDFRNNPELAEIFGVSDTETDFNVNLESQQHLEMMENHSADLCYNDLMDILDALEIILSFFL